MGKALEHFSDISKNQYWDVDGMSREELYHSFGVTDERMNIIYQFVLGYNDYINRRHNYSSKVDLTMLEVHLLTMICDQENCTVTNLAAAWNRSVSATSQTVRQLIKKDLVVRKNSPENGRIFFLCPTPQGILVSDAHKRYDVLDTIKTIKHLLKDTTIEELQGFFKVLERYNTILHRSTGGK